MKVVLIGVGAIIALLSFMYFRKKQDKIIKEIEKRPQYNVVPEEATNRLVEKIEKLTKNFETKIEPKIRKFRILLNSSDRNTSVYPQETEYELKLIDKIYGLDKLTLTKAVFPTTLQLINDNNNSFILSAQITFSAASASETYPITLTNGIYNNSSLSIMVQNAINIVTSTDPDYSTGAEFSVSIDSNTNILNVTNTVVPIHATHGTATAMTFSIQGNNYLNEILGINTYTQGTLTTPFYGMSPVNVAFPQNLLIYLDNLAHDFNSLRLLNSSEDDRRCFAYMTLPSGNGAGGTATPSAATLNGNAILTSGTGGNSGFGTYTVTKDMTNAYYKAYEGKIPLLQNIRVRIRQLLPDGTIVTPSFNGADHILEFEVKANVDKISLGYNK